VKKIINYINDSNSKHFSILLFLILTANLGYNLFFRYNYSIPYGFDEIITIWPVGQELIKSKLIDWPNILFSRFLSEDHLFPVTNFFTYFICKLNGDIIENLYWISRLCYIIILALSIIIIQNIGFSKSNIIYFIIIFLNAGPVNFAILSYNFNFNLVCILSLLTIIFYLKPQKTRNTLLFLIFCFLGTFTSENFYIIYPTVLFIFFIQKNQKNNSRSLFVIVTFLAILVFKFWLSFKYLGVVMPSSRLNLSGYGVFFNALSVVFKLFNDIYFGLPLYFVQTKKIWALIILILFSLSVFVYIRKYNKKKELILFYLILVILPFIGYTGRFHPGMWTFLELIGIFISALIFSKIINYDKTNLFYFLTFIGLFIINLIIDPYSELKRFYNQSFDSSKMAYNLIEENNEKLLLYNLADTTPMHPIAFWIGSKIYHKKQGLTFKKDEGSIHMFDINIESIKIDKNDTNSKIYVSPQKNTTTLVKTNNSIISFKNLNGLYSEYLILDDYKKNDIQEYDIFNTSYYTSLLDTFTVKIFTNKFLIDNLSIKLRYAKIYNLKQKNKYIQFDFVNYCSNEKLILNNFKSDINKIIISSKNNQFDINSRNNLEVISDKNTFFKLFNSQVEIYGRLEQFKKHNIESISIDKSSLINIQFWYYNVNTKKWDSYSENNINVDSNSILSFKDNKIFTIQTFNK
jgi:hypothetical protein